MQGGGADGAPSDTPRLVRNTIKVNLSGAGNNTRETQLAQVRAPHASPPRTCPCWGDGERGAALQQCQSRPSGPAARLGHG